MPGASGSFMIQRAWPSRDCAGNPRARRPGRASLEAWEKQLHEWGINPARFDDPDEDGRPWEVTAESGRKKTRTIRGPSSLRGRFGIEGWRINVFAAKIAVTMKRTVDGVQEGPFFWLTYNDARRLWADRDFVITPTTEG